MSRPITVLIADDHPIVREGLRLVLQRREDLEVVGEAADGRTAIRLATQLRPDVAIIDLDMPHLDGARVIAELAHHLPSCRCLVLTLHEDDTHLSDALAAGAAGFLVKGAGSADIERAVRAAAAGQMVFAPEVGPRIAQAMAANRPARGGKAFAHLTERELDLLELLAEGADNLTISRTLHLAPKTIRNQISTLLDRIAAPDRATASQAARAAGLRRPDR
jgi:DNA-binding NarL/FixJ family response regulator